MIGAVYLYCGDDKGWGIWSEGRRNSSQLVNVVLSQITTLPFLSEFFTIIILQIRIKIITFLLIQNLCMSDTHRYYDEKKYFWKEFDLIKNT